MAHHDGRYVVDEVERGEALLRREGGGSITSIGARGIHEENTRGKEDEEGRGRNRPASLEPPRSVGHAVVLPGCAPPSGAAL
jgi:hypothetical protein